MRSPWEELHSIVAVETIRQANRQAEVTRDYRFYLSSLVRSAKEFASLIRQHWDIENTLHWSLDVTCNEDRCRIRKDNAPENMAALRRLALNLLRQNPITSANAPCVLAATATRITPKWSRFGTPERSPNGRSTVVVLGPLCQVIR